MQTKVVKDTTQLGLSRNTLRLTHLAMKVEVQRDLRRDGNRNPHPQPPHWAQRPYKPHIHRIEANRQGA